MGRKKPFIDKSKATTYHVMYKEHDDAEDPFEFVSERDIRQRTEEAAEAASSRHPLAFLYENEDDQVQSEEQRQEIISMGLPDDGYNYLQHMRAPGARQQMLIVPVTAPEEQAADSSEDQQGTPGLQTFVPPAEDVMFYDASSLPVSGTDDAQETADDRQVTVSAFSRPIYHADKVAKLASIAEVTEIMAALDEDDAAFLEAEGCAPEAIMGEGDLLDDFVESAQQADAAGAQEGGALGTIGDGGAAEDRSDDEGDAPELVRRTPQSIADSFWRKDRGDRTDAQTVVDERLVARMDLEYGDDDIGSLEDDADATRSRAAWGSGDARLRKVLGAYEGSHANGRAVESCTLAEELAQLRTGTSAPEATAAGNVLEDDEAIARAKALEAAERYAHSAQHDAEGDDTADVDVEIACMGPRPVPEDCESVLSGCSTLYNHPGTISSEGGGGRRQTRGAAGGMRSLAVANAGAGMIQLSSRTGLPRAHGGLPGVSEGGSESGGDGGSDSGGGEGMVNLGQARGKGESAGDKKARKAAVKEAKRAARQRKKESKQVFAEANTSMLHHVASNSRAQRTVVHIV